MNIFKRNMVFLFSSFLSVALFFSVSQVFSQQNISDFTSEEILVKFTHGTRSQDKEAINNQIGAKILNHMKLIDVYHLKLPSEVTVESALSRYRKHPLVEHAEPNYLQRIVQTIPNDSSLDQLWGLNNTGQTGGIHDADIDAFEAWDVATGDSSVVIAVLDTGVDYRHEDLQGNIWVNPGEDIDGDGIPEVSDQNGLDDDGNGFVDDIIGWDFANNDNNPFDDHGHGTHVAGTIAGRGNNGVGITGVSWDAKIMPLKFMRANGAGLTSDAIRAIEYYTHKGIRISNNSWGGAPFSLFLFEAVQASKGLFVAAAGNDGTNNDIFPHYPSDLKLENVISVAATTDKDQLAFFSNRGTNSVDLAAPGSNILSTIPGGLYRFMSGTSMAAPHVSGVAGLLLAQDNSLTIDEMKWRILKGADNKGLFVLTGGRLNARNTLNFGLVPPEIMVTATALGPVTVSPGDTVSYTIAFANTSASEKSAQIKVFVQIPNGRLLDLNGPEMITLSAGEVVNENFSQDLPLHAPLGMYTLFGQILSSDSFDEDQIEYEVVP
ncbi:MAG: S8 family serine peptidase [Candidatus Brocadiaceae bacterium]|nr:S8 family serine peptidase [Candidatus Brocadiaceae bacterium]